jgi:DNA-3-methyladenine glycosylase I
MARNQTVGIMPSSSCASDLKSLRNVNKIKSRCPWAETDPSLRAYHDQEWGKPQHGDQRLFELLILEGAQAGLSWLTVLKKRENYRKAFDNFDPEKVSRYDKRKVNSLLNNDGIIRNRLKIEGTIRNAKVYLAVQKKNGSFDKFIWRFVDGHQKLNHWSSLKRVPASTTEAEHMSTELKKLGFTFVGPTICYAFMQAAGLVNDHITGCFRYPTE